MSNRPDFRMVAHGLVEQLITDRRDLHQHPELGFQEFRTAKIIAERLRELGYDVSEGVATTGVLGVIPPKDGGKLALLRFDMDALPIEEQNQTEYRSLEAGKMHACGHDGHVAIGLGVAAALMENRAALGDGGVKLLFQPAEEGGGGAQKMVEAGAMQNPRPDVSLGLHIWADLPLGIANVRSGPIMASADEFTVVVTGKGGHGAQPQVTVDAVLVAAQMVVALHTIVSRNVHPEQPAVLSVGSINSGTAHNIIAHTATLTGTIRTYDAEARDVIKQRLHEIVHGVAATYHATAEITYNEMCPATVCADDATELMRGAAEAVLGADNVIATERTMGSEDMSVLLNDVPGCYFFLGGKSEARELGMYAHHHPRFDFDEAVLPLGVAIMCEATTRYLTK